jgi:hypothetical protein
LIFQFIEIATQTLFSEEIRMKKAISIAVCLFISITADAWSQDYIWIPNYDIHGNSRIMERIFPPHGNIPFLQNPAFMLSQNQVIIEYDFYAQDMDFNMDLRQEGFHFGDKRIEEVIRDENYVWYSHVTTVGVVHTLGPLDALGIVFNYKRSDVRGEGDRDVSITRPPGPFIQRYECATEYDQGINAYTLDIIWRRGNETLAYGASLNFSLNEKHIQSELAAQVSASSTFPSESNKIRFYDDLSDHRIGLNIGLDWKACSSFNIASNLSAGFRFGNGERDIFAKTTGWLGPSTIVYDYRSDLDASLDGFDFGMEVNPTLILGNGFSLPFVFSFNYLNEDWSMEGTGDGFFFSFTLLYPSFGYGKISFDQEIERFSIFAGSGLRWERESLTADFSLGYRYKDQRTWHDRDNDVDRNEPTWAPGGHLTGGHNFFDQDERWKEHNLILGLGGDYHFSDRLMGTLSVTYTLRWIKARYRLDFYDTYWHFHGINPKGTERYRASDSCTASDLALRGALSFLPVKNIRIKLNAGVMIPVSDIDLDFDGDITGANWTTNSWLTYAYDESSRKVDQKAVHYTGALYIIWSF